MLLGGCGDGGSAGGAESPTATSTRPPAQTPTPSPSIAPTPALRDIKYEVEEGDVLGVIAKRFGVSVESIIQANSLVDEFSIAPGDVLEILGVDPALAGAVPAVSPNAESPIGIHMLVPVAGACLPRTDDQMPNAPREYRQGIHEGVDFFTGFACVDVPEGLPALAAADGIVIRADQEYKELTLSQLNELFERTQAQGYTDAGSLDKFRGRQVWIDHGNDIVTRYAHLSDIPRDIQVGAEVSQGRVIGFIGDTGTPTRLGQPGFEIHLHFEIRVGDSFLGEGLPPDEARALYEQVFGFR